jgi:hypothetical protein
MRRFRLVLIAMLLAVPFAVTAMAQDVEKIKMLESAPRLLLLPWTTVLRSASWGYYSYYPYSCAPYGYYGPGWFPRRFVPRRRTVVRLGLGSWLGPRRLR